MKNFDYIAPELLPENEAEADIFAQAAFVADLQSAIHRMMIAKGVSRADLAERLGVSKPRVTQYFAGDGSNLTAKTIARIFHALGEQAETTCEWLRAQEANRFAERRRQLIVAAGGAVSEMQWIGGNCWGQSDNDNCHDTNDLSVLIAASRARSSIRLEQAA
jgi:transcriptional regulator with XRE-family HTH domain